MRVSIDTNVLVSYLLAPQADSVPRAIVWAALDGIFEATISEKTIQELVHVTQTNTYLVSRIESDHLQELVGLFRALGIVGPVAPHPYMTSVRDPKDEYLVDHAVAEDVDYLVTGDRDLLELEHDHRFRVVTPAEFLAILKQQTGL